VRTERLRDRAAIEGIERPPATAFFRNLLVTAWVWGKILLRRVTIIAAPNRAAARSTGAARSALEQGELLAFEQYPMSADEADAYRRAAAWQGVKLNDLFVRDVILAVDDWNRDQASESRATCRVNVPVNVRGREGADIPASNRLGFAFVDARGDERTDRQRLLELVHFQTERIKDWKLALHFLGGLAAATGVPGVVPAILRWKRSFATVVLSNIGRLFASSRLPRKAGKLVAGNVVIEHITGVPPVRRNTRAAMIVGEYGGVTTISLRCDPRSFSADDTRALLATYVARLRETAAASNRAASVETGAGSGTAE
jgi:hypothetical protein